MNKNVSHIALLLTALAVPGDALTAQETDSRLGQTNIRALAFRNIGPAFNGGRIADIAIHPGNRNVWYVAVGSGGNYALAAARALYPYEKDAEALGRQAMQIAADICVYTNSNFTIETLDLKA